MGRKKKENKPKPNKDKVRIVESDPITLRKVIRKHIDDATIRKPKPTLFMSIRKLINKFINLMEKLWQK